MDFIIKLLKLIDLLVREEYDVILVIIDWFTKYSYLILWWG